ncbi:MAG: hypothetical protein LBS26_06710 [Campylobacteraceae bacterium]|jgi:hypothetical protein|nr:hypothetical protein [Campylobacteraceae bacterium]
MKYTKLTLTFLVTVFLAGGLSAQSFGNSDVSIEKIFPPFSVNTTSVMLLIEVFRVTDKEFNTFADILGQKAAAGMSKDKGLYVIFDDKRSKSKGVEEELFYYTFSKFGKDTLLVVATGKRTVNGDLQISGSIASNATNINESTINESTILEFLPPINAPRLAVSIRKDFKDNLTKECEEYGDTLKTKYGFDVPDIFKIFEAAHKKSGDKKRDAEIEHLLKTLFEKEEGNFKYTSACTFEGSTGIFSLEIERVKFGD